MLLQAVRDSFRDLLTFVFLYCRVAGQFFSFFHPYLGCRLHPQAYAPRYEPIVCATTNLATVLERPRLRLPSTKMVKYALYK